VLSESKLDRFTNGDPSGLSKKILAARISNISPNLLPAKCLC
jgi:hypothetical protein